MGVAHTLVETVFVTMGCHSSKKVAEPCNQGNRNGTLLCAAPADGKTNPLVFAPGNIGIEANWTSGVVTSIVPGGQAERLGVKQSWQFYTLQEGGISEPYSQDRLNEFIAGRQCYCLTFSKAATECAKGAETPIPANETVEVAPLHVATPAKVKVEAAIEYVNTKEADAPVEIETVAKYEEWRTPVVVEKIVTVTEPGEPKGIWGCAFCS